MNQELSKTFKNAKVKQFAAKVALKNIQKTMKRSPKTVFPVVPQHFRRAPLKSKRTRVPLPARDPRKLLRKRGRRMILAFPRTPAETREPMERAGRAKPNRNQGAYGARRVRQTPEKLGYHTFPAGPAQTAKNEGCVGYYGNRTFDVLKQ